MSDTDLDPQVRKLRNALSDFLAADSIEELRVILGSYPMIESGPFLYLLMGLNQGSAAEQEALAHRINLLALIETCGIEGALAEPSVASEIPHCEIGDSFPPQIPEMYAQANNAESQYHLTGNLSLLSRAVELRTKIIEDSSFEQLSFRVQFEMLNDAAAALRARYDAAGNQEDMSKALHTSQRLVDLCPPARKRYPAFLSGLGNSLQHKFNLFGSLADLDMAKDCYERAISLSPTVPMYANNLANVLNKRFNRTGEPTDLRRAIELSRQAVYLTPDSDLQRPGFLHNLGRLLSTGFALNGVLNDLDEAIAVERSCLSLIPRDSPAIPGYLNNLAISLNRRYEASGSMDDLNEAIDLQSRAVSLDPSSSPDHASYLNVLGMSLESRYQHSGKAEDLDRAVSALENALGLLDAKSPKSASFSHSLATALLVRDLGQARSVNTTKPTAKNTWLTRLLKRTPRSEPNSTPDLERSIELNRDAIRASGPGAPELPDYYSSLAKGLYIRSEATGDSVEAQEALEAMKQAAKLMGSGHPHLPGVLSQLAEWKGVGSQDATEYLRFACQRGLEVDPGTAMQAGIRWGKHCTLLQEWAEASEAFGYAILAAKKLSEVQRHREGKEHWLEHFQGIADEAAYAAAQCGDVEKAILALEAGRAVLISERLRENQDDIERVSEASGSSLTFGQVTELSRGLPLIYVVTADTGGLAILLDCSDAIPHKIIPLPALSRKGVREILQGQDEESSFGGYLGVYLQWRRDANNGNVFQRWLDELDQTTSWLWTALADPLRPLFVQLQDREVAFVVSGMVALLPLHAAWALNEESPSKRKHLPFLIRYTPSAKLLLSSKSHSTDLKNILIVDDPQPTSAGDLPFSKLESWVAGRRFRQAVRLSGALATRGSVLDLLSSTDACHLSCHAYAQLTDPLRSGMLMANDEILTLKDLLSLNSLRTRIIVLSACEAALFGTKLPDEVVSLTTGFLQAGVPTVISSFWAVTELNTFFILARLYDLWMKSGIVPSRALFDAQTWLRDTDNGAKFDVIERMLQEVASESAEHSLFRDVQSTLRQLGLREHSFSHPFFWAQFGYFGL